MAKDSTIEWTDATWNPVRGCSKVSEGCRNCYAMTLAARFSGPGLPYEGLAERRGGQAQWTNRIMLVEGSLSLPLTWRAPRRIFVNSMSDLFHEDVPQEFIYRVSLIMLKAAQHTYQVLTKRTERMANVWLTSLHCEWLRDALGNHLLTDANIHDMLRHVWIGTSVEDQAAADTRIPPLLRVPARIRFLSCEPLLGPVDLRRFLCCPYCAKEQPLVDDDGTTYHHFGGMTNIPCPLNGRGQAVHNIDWVIAGGESGHGARPMHPDWARSLRDQCAASRVPFFFKQWGAWLHQDSITPDTPDAGLRRGLSDFGKWPDGTYSYNVGKRAAGRLLDGQEWDEMPVLAISAGGAL